jgi:hypothetical protein
VKAGHIKGWPSPFKHVAKFLGIPGIYRGVTFDSAQMSAQEQPIADGPLTLRGRFIAN